MCILNGASAPASRGAIFQHRIAALEPSCYGDRIYIFVVNPLLDDKISRIGIVGMTYKPNLIEAECLLQGTRLSREMRTVQLIEADNASLGYDLLQGLKRFHRRL